jgi:hypothetical protein
MIVRLRNGATAKRASREARRRPIMKTDRQIPESPESISGVKSGPRIRPSEAGEVAVFFTEMLFLGFSLRLSLEDHSVVTTREKDGKTIKISFEFIEDAKNFPDVTPSRREGFWRNAANILAHFVAMTFDMWPIEPPRMREMWRRFLIVRGFIDAFGPENDDFDKDTTKAFIIYGPMGLAEELHGRVLASMPRKTVDDRKPAGVVNEAMIRRGDVVGFDVKDSAMPRALVRVTSMKFIDSYREGGRILDLDVEPAAE